LPAVAARLIDPIARKLRFCFGYPKKYSRDRVLGISYALDIVSVRQPDLRRSRVVALPATFLKSDIRR